MRGTPGPHHYPSRPVRRRPAAMPGRRPCEEHPGLVTIHPALFGDDLPQCPVDVRVHPGVLLFRLGAGERRRQPGQGAGSHGRVARSRIPLVWWPGAGSQSSGGPELDPNRRVAEMCVPLCRGWDCSATWGCTLFRGAGSHGRVAWCQISRLGGLVPDLTVGWPGAGAHSSGVVPWCGNQVPDFRTPVLLLTESCPAMGMCGDVLGRAGPCWAVLGYVGICGDDALRSRGRAVMMLCAVRDVRGCAGMLQCR